MKVILTQDVSGLGKRYDIKNVSDGHAINLLIPQGLVSVATPAALKQAEKEKARTEAEREIHENLLAKNLASVDGKSIHMIAKANEQGHLFAAIHEGDIVKRLKEELHVDTRPEYVKLSEHVKTVGEHKVEILVQDKKAHFTLVVEASK